MYLKTEEIKPKHIETFKRSIFLFLVISRSSFMIWILEECQQRVDLLGRYKQAFAFAALPLFDHEGKLRREGTVNIEDIKLFKWEEDIFYVIESLSEDFAVPFSLASIVS